MTNTENSTANGMNTTINTKEQTPLISVYMPTRNRAHLLEKAVRSVLEQTWQNLELIIVNDASTDNTAEVLAQWQARDSRIKVFHNAEPLKACASRNRAIQAATGEFITGIDDDDEFLPERLATLASIYDDRYAFVSSGYYWHNGKKESKVLCQNATIDLSQQLCYNQVSNQVFVRTARLLEIGGFDENFVSLQDYDCFTRLIKRFGPAYRIGKPLIRIYALASENRISNTNQFWLGYDQFLAQHHADMSEVQIANAKIMATMRQGGKITLRSVIKTMAAGNTVRKLKYIVLYLVTNKQKPTNE